MNGAGLIQLHDSRTAGQRVRRRLRAAVEQAFGVTVSRTPPFQPNQYADAALRRLRRWTAHDVVFDVGANDGRTILRVRDQLCRPRIYAFEPVASTYRTLVQRTSGMDKVRTFQVALGAAAGRADMYLNPSHAMNSLLPGWTAEPRGTESVEVTTLDRVMADEGVDFIHFLKIDTEGHDLEVLKGARQALQSSRVALLQVEVGFDQMTTRRFPTLEDVRQYLAPFGYALSGIYNQCRTSAQPAADWTVAWRAGFDPSVLVYCDALFLRADLIR